MMIILSNGVDGMQCLMAVCALCGRPRHIQWSEDKIKADPSLEGLGFDSACPLGFEHSCT